MHIHPIFGSFKKTAVLFLLIFSVEIGYSQTNPISIKEDTIIISLSRIAGLGPQGNNSFGIGSYEENKNTEEFKAYPTIKNLPGNLTNVVQYLYILDQFQFFYQNYVSGIYSKSFFLKKAAEMQWRLADTIHLSKKPVKCAFAVLAGIDSNKNEVVIVDANNNDDFSDDIIKPLFKNVHSEEQIIKGAISVQTSYFSRGAIHPDKVLVLLQRDRNPTKLDLSFTFPEFNFTKFYYKRTAYFLCADDDVWRKYICVLPERPYFTQVSPGGLITLNHFVKIGDTGFKFIGYDRYEHVVTLKGPPDGFSATQAAMTAFDNPTDRSPADTIVSDQVGFKAPLIRGKNMNPMLNNNNQISTANLHGKYIFVDFWSTYCAPCILELPFLKSAYEKYPRDRFEIIGVFDERDSRVTKKLFESNKVNWPNIRMQSKDSEISGYGHVYSFPTNYLIDPSGKIVAYNLRSDDLMNTLEELIGH